MTTFHEPPNHNINIAEMALSDVLKGVCDDGEQAVVIDLETAVIVAPAFDEQIIDSPEAPFREAVKFPVRRRLSERQRLPVALRFSRQPKVVQLSRRVQSKHGQLSRIDLFRQEAKGILECLCNSVRKQFVSNGHR